MNKYVKNTQELISKITQPLPLHFTGPNRESAQLDDLVWYYHADNKRRTRLLCCVFDGERRRYDHTLTDDLALPNPYNHLLKIFIINVFNKSCSAGHKQAAVIEARYILTNVSDIGLHNLTAHLLNELYKKRNPDDAHAFIAFCHERKIVSSKVMLHFSEDRDRTGEEYVQDTISKLPNEDGIIALGNIYKKVFENVSYNGKIKKGYSVDTGDALVIAMVCLALGSPNRAKAEQLVLTKQKMEKNTKDGTTVCSLTWQGSKGFNDNKKHILGSMHKPIEKCLNYFYVNSEKARILSSFYHTPNQPVNELLKDFQVDSKRLELVKNKKGINLFQLGFLLGFYPINQSVKVISKDHADLIQGGVTICHYNSEKPLRGNYIRRRDLVSNMIEKGVFDLEDSDLIYVSSSTDNTYTILFGTTLNSNIRLIEKGVQSIKNLQDAWITYFKEEVIPEFPLSYSPSENYVDLRFAMFAITGKDIPTGIKMGSRTYYYIFPISRLSSYLNSRIRKHDGSSIFKKHGYSSSLGFNSHSLRHYNNTLASLSDIPISIITAWSGRVSAEQTHTYIHTDDGYKSERVNMVTQQSVPNKNIRVQSLDLINKSSETWATVTSTGVCKQNITVTPCEHLNDFISQCFLCPQACYVCGDNEAISLLSKDYEYQKRRLSTIEKDKRIITSKAMQRWFKLHYSNTHILEQLISILENKTKGGIVNFSIKEKRFIIKDFYSEKVHSAVLELPDAHKQLSLKINELRENESSKDTITDNVLLNEIADRFGLKKEDL